MVVNMIVSYKMIKMFKILLHEQDKVEKFLIRSKYSDDVLYSSLEIMPGAIKEKYGLILLKNGARAYDYISTAPDWFSRGNVTGYTAHMTKFCPQGSIKKCMKIAK